MSHGPNLRALMAFPPVFWDYCLVPIPLLNQNSYPLAIITLRTQETTTKDALVLGTALNIIPKFQLCPYFLSHSSKTSRNPSSLSLRTEERGGLRNLPFLFPLGLHVTHFNPLGLKVPAKQKASQVLLRKRRGTILPKVHPLILDKWEAWYRSPVGHQGLCVHGINVF